MTYAPLAVNDFYRCRLQISPKYCHQTLPMFCIFVKNTCNCLLADLCSSSISQILKALANWNTPVLTARSEVPPTKHNICWYRGQKTSTIKSIIWTSWFAHNHCLLQCCMPLSQLHTDTVSKAVPSLQDSSVSYILIVDCTTRHMLISRTNKHRQWWALKRHHMNFIICSQPLPFTLLYTMYRIQIQYPKLCQAFKTVPYLTFWSWIAP